MDTRPLAALLRQLESTTVDVARICFYEKSGEIQSIELHSREEKQEKIEAKPIESKTETIPDKKKKITAIDSLKLADRFWPVEQPQKAG